MSQHGYILGSAFLAISLISLVESGHRYGHRSRSKYQSVIPSGSVRKSAVPHKSPSFISALPSPSPRKRGSKGSPLIVTPNPKEQLRFNSLSFPEIVEKLKLPLSVVQFTSTSIKQILASESLRRAFGVTNKKEDKSAYFEALENMMERAGVVDKMDPAKKATMKFSESYDKLNSFKHSLAIIISIGKYLFQHGALTEESANDVAHTLLAQMSTLTEKVSNDSDRLYYFALVDGFVNFMLPLGVFGPETAPVYLDIYDEIVPFIAAYSLPTGFV